MCVYTFTQNIDVSQPGSQMTLSCLSEGPPTTDYQPEPDTARLRQPRLVSTDPRPDIPAMLDATSGMKK